MVLPLKDKDPDAISVTGSRLDDGAVPKARVALRSRSMRCGRCPRP